jgi:catechol 2,3-dioxygenase-like lactoylglutathione lyase family enzyme
MLAPVQVIFAVSDLQRTLGFYESAFGWPRNDRIDFRNYVELLPPDGGSVGFYERSGFATEVGAEPVAVNGDQVAPAYLYVRVPDVRATIANLEEAGGRPLSPLSARAWGEEASWFADPDGNLVAVAQLLEV